MPKSGSGKLGTDTRGIRGN